MKVLLDTHVFLWWIIDDDRISPKAGEIMRSGDNKLFLSVASGWEIAIKSSLGKIKIPGEKHLAPFIHEQIKENGMSILPIHMSHALHVYQLPYYHSDPFDRILIAQAQLEKLPLLSADGQFQQYDIEVSW